MASRADTQKSENRAAAYSDADGRQSGTAQSYDSATISPKKPFFKRPWVIAVACAIAVVIVVGGISYWLYARQYESTDDAFIDGRAVQISPKVAGYVRALRIGDNQLVKSGDLLLEIDPRDFEAALNQARAALEAAQAQVKQANAQIVLASATEKAAEANVKSAEATATNASRILGRSEKANESVPGSVSAQEIDQERANERAANAALTSARDKVIEAKARTAAANSDLFAAVAKVRQFEAAVRSAELNLSYTKLTAPVTGRVTHRMVERGDYVQPGQALFALVKPDYWVTANFKETQLTNMKVGQPATVEIDAFPDYKLSAHVDSFQRGTGAQFSLLPPENATGNYVKVVQRIPVKIVFDEPIPPGMILGPGMSVVPRVKVR
jgi:membrane fusion protein (multidrug efflux system)